MSSPPQTQAAARVVLKPRKAQPFFGRHPWVFEGAIQYVDGECQDGDVVDVLTEKQQFVARGVINTRSKLHVRLYSWDEHQALDAAFWDKRIEQAIRLREGLPSLASRDAQRMVFSEADQLSGLIVDRYARHLVVQLNSLSMSARWPELQPILIRRFDPQSIIVRSDRGTAKDEGMEVQGGVVWGTGPEGPIEIVEHGIKFRVDLTSGQKTGWYLDQADNHRSVAPYVGGRRVLDLFSYTGGFALAAALLGKATSVLGVDGSERAIQAGKENAALNGLDNVEFKTEDVFEFLDRAQSDETRYGAIILDPPKFARSRRQVDEALRAYHRINRLAVELLEPGGILVTCSCSGGVSREDFNLMLSGVSQKSRRAIQILEQRGASPDHPVSVTCLETEYLKCFICRVN